MPIVLYSVSQGKTRGAISVDFKIAGNKDDEALELEAIREWLSPCAFESVQSTHLGNLFPDLDQWFLDHELFSYWESGGRPWIFRCTGEQGSGKVSLRDNVCD